MVSASKSFDENYAKHSIVYSTKNSTICGAKNVVVYHIKIMNQGNVYGAIRYYLILQSNLNCLLKFGPLVHTFVVVFPKLFLGENLSLMRRFAILSSYKP